MQFRLEGSIRMKEFKRKIRLEPFRVFISLRRMFIAKPAKDQWGHSQFRCRMRRNALIIFILPVSPLLFGKQIGWCRMYEINTS